MIRRSVRRDRTVSSLTISTYHNVLIQQDFLVLTRKSSVDIDRNFSFKEDQTQRLLFGGNCVAGRKEGSRIRSASLMLLGRRALHVEHPSCIHTALPTDPILMRTLQRNGVSLIDGQNARFSYQKVGEESR